MPDPDETRRLSLRHGSAHPRPLTRRVFVTGTAAGLVATGMARAQDTATQDASGILVNDPPAADPVNGAGLPGTGSATRLVIAGTADTPSGKWATALAPLMAHALDRPAFSLETTTGWDGVTGANLFDAQQQAINAPAALVAPGTTMLTSMTGDMRVHYDYQRWMPVLIARQPTVAVGRVALHRSLGAILGNQQTKVAVLGPTGPELPTLLALDLLGLRPLPVSGYGTPDAAMAALRAGSVNAIQLPLDADFAGRMADLRNDGFAPLFVNTTRPLSGEGVQDLPDFMSVLRQEHPKATLAPLAATWHAVAAAASIKTALLLPLLTPPASVARWRHAAEMCAANPAIRQEAADNRDMLLSGAECMSFYMSLMPDVNVILGLRRWLALNLPRWRNGMGTGKL
ncbi:hypothetical protein [Acetobacter sp.]|uniref:hypothetical protein n=1 Tax=Acetobacter sp. TaxID=440 RepID=UPI0039E77868